MSNVTSTNAHLAPQEVPTTASTISAALETTAPTSSPSPDTTQPNTTSSTVAPTTAPITTPATSPPPPTPTPPAQPPPTSQAPNPSPEPPPDQSPKPPNQPTQSTSPQPPQPPKASPTPPAETTNTKPDAAPENTAAPIFVTVTLSPTSPGGSSVVTIIQTSTHAGNSGSKSTSFQSSSPTSTPELQRDPSDGSNNGLSGGAKIAVAVIVPLLAVTLVVLAALFIFRRRKQRKHAEELRRKEVEEYGYNPNQDPTIPVIGSLDSNGKDPQEMREENAGYRGWGATAPAPAPVRNNSNKMSASSNSAVMTGIGMAYSEGESPTHGTMSDTKSDNPLISELNGYSNERDPLGNMGPTTTGNSNVNINRGNSNASSSYSAANRSDESGEINGRYYGQQYSSENYSRVPDNTTGRVEMPAQPVIRDVQARRNTRIESPSHFPQQSTGISQNF